jgi:mono/diheme cytochrome c family protein
VRVHLWATVVVSLAAATLAQVAATPPHAYPSKASQIAAGKYLVENVALCGSCHTPHLPNGASAPGKSLMGGHMSLPAPIKGRWAPDAPRIAGLRRWEDDEIVILLTTGKLETGLPMRPPMPQFHMSEQDARAVVAYLRSLSPPPVNRFAKVHHGPLPGGK